MAEGDLITKDFQVEVRGKLFGPGTNWRVHGLERFRSRSLKTTDTPLTNAHGSVAGADYIDADAKVVRLNCGDGALSPAAVIAELDALDVAWAPAGDSAIVYQLGGEKRRRHGRFRNIDPDVNRLVFGYVEVLCEFVDEEGLAYSATLHSASTGLPSPGSGFSPPFTPPFSLGAAASTGALSVPNAGPAPAPWSARLDGPLTRPAITHVGQGSTLDLSLSGGLVLGATDFVLIDSRTQSVLLNGTTDRRSVLDLGSEWFDLDPGANSILFAADAGSGTFTINWRDAYWA